MSYQTRPPLLSRVGSVLAVGFGSPDEFAEAARLTASIRRVVVANPRETAAAEHFARGGGRFLRSGVESLPRSLGPFGLILENYPFTIGLVPGVCEEDPCPFWWSARAVANYAMARLGRLAPGGRWVLWTESGGLARALCRLLRRSRSLRQRYLAQVTSTTRGRAPRSAYPRLPTRFRVTIRRGPAL